MFNSKKNDRSKSRRRTRRNLVRSNVLKAVLKSFFCSSSAALKTTSSAPQALANAKKSCLQARSQPYQKKKKRTTVLLALSVFLCSLLFFFYTNCFYNDTHDVSALFRMSVTCVCGVLVRHFLEKKKKEEKEDKTETQRSSHTSRS